MGGGFTGVYTFAKTHLIVPLKWVHFTSCKLCINKVNLKSNTNKQKQQGFYQSQQTKQKTNSNSQN